MKDFKSQEKAIVLVSILLLTALLVIMTTSMIIITKQSHNITGKATMKANSKIAAMSGLEFARYQLNMDPSWGETPNTPDVDMIVADGQEFHITFNTSSSYCSTNNLNGKTSKGTTPPYSVEIISEGLVKIDGEVKSWTCIRGIFVRDDDYPCPVYSEGSLLLDAIGSPAPVYTLSGSETSLTPVRIHSNTDVKITGDTGTGSTVDLTEGYASSCNTVTITDINNDIFVKESSVPMKISEVDIADVISKRPSDPNDCLDLPSDKFYLVGYFEYDAANPDDPNDPKYTDPNDPNYIGPYNEHDSPYITDDTVDDPNISYCIPHSSYQSVPEDPNNPTCLTYVDKEVYSSSGFKLGIVSFSEVSCDDFLDNYGDFYYEPNMLASGAANRDFYDYYDNITFHEYNSDPNSDFQTWLHDDLGMKMDKTLSDPNDSSSTRILTLTLLKDLYIPSVNGFFETDWIGVVDGSAPVKYYPDSMDNIKVKMDLNEYNFYGGKLWLGIPPCGAGGIISTESIDIIYSFQAEPNEVMLALSDESVRINYREPAREENALLSYRGILYAKDDIMIMSNSPYRRNKTLEVYGSMVCKNIPESNFSTSPFLCYTMPSSPDLNLYLEGKTLDNFYIYHTDDGLGTLAALRGKDFTIRRVLCEVIN